MSERAIVHMINITITIVSIKLYWKKKKITRNNTDGNKLVIFSGIALYYGDDYTDRAIILEAYTRVHRQVTDTKLENCMSIWLKF